MTLPRTPKPSEARGRLPSGTHRSAAQAEDDDDETAFGRLVGSSEVMRTASERLSRVAGRDTTVLLEGESGTGKRLAAELVHAASSRRTGPFVHLDCRCDPAVLDAELFGHDGSAGAAAVE